MPRKPSPCGTKAAYDRHLRMNEAPCEACTKANRSAQREKREKARRPAEPQPGVTVPEGTTRLGDLERQREVLWAAIQWAAVDDPARVSPLSKELREIWREIEEIRAADDVTEEADPLGAFLDSDNILPFRPAEDRQRA